MNIIYGIKPETFKLVWGNKSEMNVDKVAEMPKAISLVSGKKDTACFQVVITADQAYALNVTKAPWFSQNPKRRNLRVSAEMPFPCQMNHIGLLTCDDGLKRGDILLDKSVVEADADEILSVFCEMKIPENAQKGSYKGKVKIYENFGFSREELVGELEVSLEVYGYVFPENADNGFHLDLWLHPSNIARQHGVELWSDRHFEILEPYCKTMGELGVKSVTVIASEIPWNGQACQDEQRNAANLFEYSMIPVTRKADGSLSFDYSVMQRYIDMNAKCGVEECISVFGLVNVWDSKAYGGKRTAPDYPDGTHIRVYDESVGVFDYLRTAKEIDEYIKSLETYFINTNQIDKVRIAADEPADIEAYRKSLDHIKAVAPAFKYKTAINHAEFVAEFGKDIYDFAPYISAMFSEYDKLMNFRAEMPDKRFLYYVCGFPEVPNNLLRSELIDGYYIGILCAYAKMDGFLRWSYTCWSDFPLEDQRFGVLPVGDLCFVYPSSAGTPLLSLRWKSLFRGVRFFTLLKQAENKNLTEVLENAYSLVMREREIAKLYANWDREKVMSLDAEDYNRTLALLMTALEEK